MALRGKTVKTMKAATIMGRNKKKKGEYKIPRGGTVLTFEARWLSRSCGLGASLTRLPARWLVSARYV